MAGSSAIASWALCFAKGLERLAWRWLDDDLKHLAEDVVNESISIMIQTESKGKLALLSYEVPPDQPFTLDEYIPKAVWAFLKNTLWRVCSQTNQRRRPQLNNAAAAAAQSRGPTPDQLAVEHETDVQLWRHLDKLPKEQCDVILMRFFVPGEDGKKITFARIGEALGISEGNAMRIYHNALTALRKTEECPP